MNRHVFYLALALILCVLAQAQAADELKTKSLHEAAKAGSVEQVSANVSAGAEVNEKDAEGMTPLMHAALNGRRAVVELLLKNGADGYARCRNDWSAMMYAASADNQEIVRLLMRWGLPFTPFEAVEVGYLPVLRLLDKEYPHELFVVDKYRRTILHKAVETNRPDVVRFLIEAGLDVNAKDAYFRTPITECCKGKGRGEVVKMLVEAGADVNVQAEGGCPLLYEFVRLGDVDMIRTVIEAGADVNARCRYGPREAPIHYAAREDNVEIGRLLIENGADLNVPDPSGKTPLQLARFELRDLLIAHGAEFPTHDAAARGDIEAMRELLDKKQRNIEDEDREGYTALHVAAREGQKEMVAFLLERRADIEAWDDQANHPLHLAVEAGQKEIVLFLLEKGARVDWGRQGGYTILDIAANNRDYPMMELLFANGVDPNLRDRVYERTRLHWACKNVFEEEVKLLLKHGADVNARDDKAMTPLYHLALGYNSGYPRAEGVELPMDNADWDEDQRAIAAASCRIAEMLLDAGADLSVQREKCFLTALHMAASKGREDLVEIFLNRGADINATSERGMPIHQAAAGGDLEVLAMLIKRGADLHARDKCGGLPLDYAVSNHQPAAAGFLLERGADIAAVDNGGNTCLHVIATDGHIDMIDFLVQHGADINKKNNRGMTPLDTAMNRKEYQAAEHLRALGGVEGETKQVSAEGQ